MEYLQYYRSLGGNDDIIRVLNLIINGIPSIPTKKPKTNKSVVKVLNLIINGIPSIQNKLSI